MIAEFHFLRPYWLLACLPLALLAYGLFKKKPSLMHGMRYVTPIYCLGSSSLTLGAHEPYH